MKIKITYSPNERDKVRLIARIAQQIMEPNGSRVKESDKHPPYRHIYISSKEPPRETGED